MRVGRCLAAVDADENPARSPVNCNKQIPARSLTSHLWQVLHVDVQISRLISLEPAVSGPCTFAFKSRRLPMPCRRGHRSSPERETSGFRNPRITASRSSRDTGSVLRRATATASCAGVSVVCSRCAMWLRSFTLSRLRHFHTVCSVVPYRLARTRAGASLA